MLMSTDGRAGEDGGRWGEASWLRPGLGEAADNPGQVDTAAEAAIISLAFSCAHFSAHALVSSFVHSLPHGCIRRHFHWFV